METPTLSALVVAVVILLLILIYVAGRHRKCSTERACAACTERLSTPYAAGFGPGYAAGAEHMVPTFNMTYFDSLKDHATKYYYDQLGMTMSDYALERRLLAANP